MVPAQSACLQELSQAQRDGVLLMARLWRLEHDKSLECQAKQLAARAHLLLLELKLAGVAGSACLNAACEVLDALDSSGQLAVGFRHQQQLA